jgi:hypothetical protein
MINTYKKRFITIACILLSYNTYAQDDLFNMLDSLQPAPKKEKVYATFKATKVINAHSTETVKKNNLDFKITHRFGNMGVNSSGHTLFGFDEATNIRFSFDYGVTDRLMLGIGRSKTNEHIDGSIKYKILEQTTDNKMPLTLVIYSNMAITPKRDLSGTGELDKFAHRISYVHQLILGRKFNDRLSFEILPTFLHRNFIRYGVNPSNGVEDSNDILAIGAAGRIKLTKRLSIVGDYFYTFSDYRTSDNSFYMPLSIGVEIETGGHVFHINLSNASGIIENDFLPDTRESWTDGAFKFGFNISRMFRL